jgi:hypothetical protein
MSINPEHINQLAAIIREVDRGLFAHELAEAIMSHPGWLWQPPAALAQPEGEGPSERIVSIAKAVQEHAFGWEPDARLIGNVCAEDVADLCGAILAHQPCPTAPPVPEAGEVREVVADLNEIAGILCGMEKPLWAARLAAAATLLLQLSAPAQAVVPVAVEALTRLYWWSGMSGSYGYSADVVLGVRDWINGGMTGGLPPLPAWVADRCPPLTQAGDAQS